MISPTGENFSPGYRKRGYRRRWGGVEVMRGAVLHRVVHRFVHRNRPVIHRVRS
jgi:hypothetical protein